MVKRKKLNIAIFHLAFIYSGGGEKLVLQEARGLEKRGYQVTIFTPVLNKQKCFPDIIGQYKINTFLPKLPFSIPQREVLQVLMACLLVPVFAHRFKNFDIILAANQPSLWLAWVIKKLYGVPYVAYLAQPTRFLHPRKIDMETGLFFTGRRGLLPATFVMNISKPLGNWIDKVSIKGANLVFANGKHVSTILHKTYKIQAISCPAGAYPARGAVNNKSKISKGKMKVGKRIISKPYILITNRHFPQKRFEYAIMALPTILKKYPNFSLLITGKETNYTQNLKNLVKQLSLEEKVVFLGLVKERDLEKLYANASVYVYTAPEEDFGMGVVEAMACATPVVAWDAAGPSKIIKNGKTGLLAKPYVNTDFVDKIQKVLAEEKYARKIGTAAWEEVKKNFSFENHIDILEKGLLEEAK
jgi:glycosyltransferase involved in cell wall biosynthesis